MRRRFSSAETGFKTPPPTVPQGWGAWLPGPMLIAAFVLGILGTIAFGNTQYLSNSNVRFGWLPYSTEVSWTQRLLNADRTPRLHTVPKRLAELMSFLVYESAGFLPVDTPDTFYTLYRESQQAGKPILSPTLYIMDAVSTVGGNGSLFILPDDIISTFNMPSEVPLDARAPILVEQGCVGSCYANAAQASYQYAYEVHLSNLYGAASTNVSAHAEALANLAHYNRPSRAFMAWQYKRNWKPVLDTPMLGQGGHSIASMMTVMNVGAPHEADYDYPAKYYNGAEIVGTAGTPGCANCTRYRCTAPDVSDEVLSDAFDKYVQAPPPGVNAAGRQTGYAEFGVKVVWPFEPPGPMGGATNVTDVLNCAFSVENACETLPHLRHTMFTWIVNAWRFVDVVRRWIAAGYAPVINIPVFSDWSAASYPYIIPYPPAPGATPIGYHALTAVGYSSSSTNCGVDVSLNTVLNPNLQAIDGGCIILRNSWGPSVGNGGYHTMAAGMLFNVLWSGQTEVAPIIPNMMGWPFTLTTEFSYRWAPLLASNVVAHTPTNSSGRYPWPRPPTIPPPTLEPAPNPTEKCCVDTTVSLLRILGFSNSQHFSGADFIAESNVSPSSLPIVLTESNNFFDFEVDVATLAQASGLSGRITVANGTYTTYDQLATAVRAAFEAFHNANNPPVLVEFMEVLYDSGHFFLINYGQDPICWSTSTAALSCGSATFSLMVTGGTEKDCADECCPGGDTGRQFCQLQLALDSVSIVGLSTPLFWNNQMFDQVLQPILAGHSTPPTGTMDPFLFMAPVWASFKGKTTTERLNISPAPPLAPDWNDADPGSGGVDLSKTLTSVRSWFNPSEGSLQPCTGAALRLTAKSDTIMTVDVRARGNCVSPPAAMLFLVVNGSVPQPLVRFTQTGILPSTGGSDVNWCEPYSGAGPVTDVCSQSPITCSATLPENALGAAFPLGLGQCTVAKPSIQPLTRFDFGDGIGPGLPGVPTPPGGGGGGLRPPTTPPQKAQSCSCQKSDRDFFAVATTPPGTSGWITNFCALGGGVPYRPNTATFPSTSGLRCMWPATGDDTSQSIGP